MVFWKRGGAWIVDAGRFDVEELDSNEHAWVRGKSKELLLTSRQPARLQAYAG